MNILVTGGAGFIGSHLIDRLIELGHTIVCLDDLSLGKEANIAHHVLNPQFKFYQMDVLQKNQLETVFKTSVFDVVFHMVANSDIQKGSVDLEIDLNRTFLTTFTILQMMKQYQVKQFVFASSSAIYGEHSCQLTENLGPLFPISYYGAAKLASEAYIAAFQANYGIQSWIFRFPNVIGERTTHGVIFDFIKKLTNNNQELEILGNGKQQKPYLYVKDLVDGILFGWQQSKEVLNYFNLGVDSVTSVTKIAELVVQEMGLHHVQFCYTGGDRGWVGDVPFFDYDLSKINQLGWKAKRSSDDAVRLAIRAELDYRKHL